MPLKEKQQPQKIKASLRDCPTLHYMDTRLTNSRPRRFLWHTGTFHDSLTWPGVLWPDLYKCAGRISPDLCKNHRLPTQHLPIPTHLKSLYDACMFPLFSTKLSTCWRHQLSSPCGTFTAFWTYFTLSQRGHHGHHGEPPTQTNLLPQSILAPSKLLPRPQDASSLPRGDSLRREWSESL